MVSVSKVMKNLTSAGLLTNISSDGQHPLYVIAEESRTINALIFLSLAWQDDRDGTTLMDECVRDYAEKTLGMRSRSAGKVKNQTHEQVVTSTCTIRRRKH
jgi:hypothetical protein